MPALSTRISRLAGPSCRSILYCNPEQPPPTTATRRTPCARPCLANKELTLRAALAVTLIRRSSPVRTLRGPDALGIEAAIMQQPTGYLRLTPASTGPSLLSLLCRSSQDRG